MIPRFSRNHGIAQVNVATRQKFFTNFAELNANVGKIIEELLAVQGKPVDIGGY